MAQEFAQRLWRLAGEVVLQTVPPSLLSAYAATELAAATGMTILQCASIIGAGILACLLIAGSSE